MITEIKTVRLKITGKVQGVGYRYWAVRKAESLGLRGWVRNRLDGSVEAVVTGFPHDVAAMIEASRQGPPGAQVTDVAVIPGEADDAEGFVVRRTE
jgi:acylphosphatase